MEFPRFCRFGILALAAAIGCLNPPNPAGAQGPGSWEAYTGEPLGVGRLRWDFGALGPPDALGPEGVRVTDPQSRVFYPAVVQEPLRGSLRGLIQSRRRAYVYFLFRGGGPLEVTFRGQTYSILPGGSRAARDRLLAEWWAAYRGEPSGLVERLVRSPGEATVVDVYLQAMLSRRLGLAGPASHAGWQTALAEDPAAMFQTGDVQQALLGRRVGGGAASGPADRPLPEPPAAPALAIPAEENVEIEPIALRVPQEAFYLRFGSFSNFLWFQDTLQRGGGDLGSLVALQAVARNTSERMQRQLGLKQTALARLMGDAAISDVALIGTDVFFNEGPAVGLLFEARSSMVLAADITSQRREAMAAVPGAREETLTIAGKPVSCIASPDNAMRSFYAADGAYHLVTNSRVLAERFLEAAAGQGALGASAGFRHARSLLPLSRGDTVAAYLGDEFYQHLFGPHSWVELCRRTEAGADLLGVQLALLAAQGEGMPHATLDELVQGGFLPPEFGSRADGSRTLLQDGRPVDSLRGGRGTLAPIPDVPVERITADEAASWERLQQRLAGSALRQIGPIAIGIQHRPADAGREVIAIDVAVTPVASELGGLLARGLGEPTTSVLGPVSGDVAWGQLAFRDQTVAGGLRDFQPPVLLLGEAVLSAGLPRRFLNGYLATDGPGLEQLDWLQLRFAGEADAQGYTRGLLGLWKLANGPYRLYAFHREILDEVAPQLRAREAERPAQVRFHGDDLGATRMAALLNELGYRRAREACRENVRWMHRAAQQLGVPMADARAVVEAILDGRLASPLGGDYRLLSDSSGDRWMATALEDEKGSARGMPAGYRAAPLNWLRRFDLEARFADGRLEGHVELLADWPGG